MPPRPTPPSNGSSRRRPSPVVPSNWLWLVLLILSLGGLFFAISSNTGSPLETSDFYKLLEKKKIAKVTFQGEDTITGEVKDDFKDEASKEYRIRNGRFTTSLPK